MKQKFEVRFLQRNSWNQKIVTVEASSVGNAVRKAQEQAPKSAWTMISVKQV